MTAVIKPQMLVLMITVLNKVHVEAQEIKLLIYFRINFLILSHIYFTILTTMCHNQFTMSTVTIGVIFGGVQSLAMSRRLKDYKTNTKSSAKTSEINKW